jgi:hypothetical protein
MISWSCPYDGSEWWASSLGHNTAWEISPVKHRIGDWLRSTAGLDAAETKKALTDSKSKLIFKRQQPGNWLRWQVKGWGDGSSFPSNSQRPQRLHDPVHSTKTATVGRLARGKSGEVPNWLLTSTVCLELKPILSLHHHKVVLKLHFYQFWGSNGGDYDCYCLLGCEAVKLGSYQTRRCNNFKFVFIMTLGHI